MVEKIVIPLMSATIAAVAIVFAVKSEGLKIRTQRAEELTRSTRSILARTLYCEGLVKLVMHSGNDKLFETRLEDFKIKLKSIIDDILISPEITLAIDSAYKMPDRSQLLLLLAEARARALSLDKNSKVDLIIYFALLTLQYLFDQDDESRNSAYMAMKKSAEEDENLRGLLVPRREPLRF